MSSRRIVLRHSALPRRRWLATSARLVGAAAGAAIVSVAPASAGESRSDGGRIRRTNPSTLAPPRGYSHVVEASGRTVYVSGQVALDAKGSVVGIGRMEAQARQVFTNIRLALEGVGATFKDVVKLTYFVCDVSQVQVIRDVRDTFIDPAQPPASTLVEVQQLVRPEFLLEVDAVAVVR